MGETGLMRLCKLPWGLSLTHIRLGRYGLQPTLKPVWDVISPTPLSPNTPTPTLGAQWVEAAWPQSMGIGQQGSMGPSGQTSAGALGALSPPR